MTSPKPIPSPLLGKMESVNTSRRDEHLERFKAQQEALRKVQPWPKRKAKKWGR